MATSRLDVRRGTWDVGRRLQAPGSLGKMPRIFQPRSGNPQASAVRAEASLVGECR